MTATDEQDRPNAGRPRAPKIDLEILKAARKLLSDKGYEALTFDAIAKATGIARPTIYRRWPSKAHLAAAIAYGGDKTLPALPDVELEVQIHALVQQVADQYGRPEIGAASIGLIPAFHNDKALRRELHTPAEKAARQQMRAIIEGAKTAGRVHEDADADTVFDMIIGAVVFRLIFSSTKKPGDFVDKLVEHICRSLRTSTQ